MVLFNYSTKELTAKIVYYGPGLCGKTSNLQYIHGNLPGNVKGKMLSLATKTDRTLFFDFLPIDLGDIRGMKTRVQLYTVPGQVFYNETRKLVLKGADGIVFVADSQEQMLSANAESFKNLEENLKGHGLTLADMPHVIQFNKRDLPKLASIEQLNSVVNKYNAPFYESVATTGIGIQDTLKAITKLVLLHLTRKYDPRQGVSASRPAAASPAPARPIAARPPAAPAFQMPTPGPAETQAIPLASIMTSIEPAPTISAAVEPAVFPVHTGGPEFDDVEIDELVGEVEDLDEFAATAPQAETVVVETSGMFQIDETNVALEDPVEAAPILSARAPGISPPPTIAPVDEVEPAEIGWAPETALSDRLADFEAAQTDFAEGFSPARDVMADEVLLTDVADDQALFDDPNLEVAGLASGEEREIVIPVEIGAGGAMRRFKLHVRLRLDPVD